MSQKRKAQVPDVELQQECRQDQESTNNSTNGNDQQQQQQDPGLNVDCKESINLPPPMQADDSIITQFKPVEGQWELNDDNINRIDPKYGETILHNYCKYINTTPLEVYRFLIETKGCNVNVQGKDKNTPLRNALRYFQPRNGCDITVLTYLLNQMGVNVNIKGQWGYTLLHTACININKLPIDVFKLLIETMGCDINAQNNNDDTPLHFAFRTFNLNNGGDITVLTYLLTQKGINVNIKGDYGDTILHTACKYINYLPLDIFKLLIETLGCDVNARNNYESTPLHALRNFNPHNGGDINALTYLINQKNLNFNIKDKYDLTLLHAACGNINKLPIDVFKVLIETHGCDVNAQDEDNNTPIHRAIDQFKPHDGGDITVLTYLLNQENLNVKIKTQNGYNLLHLACINNLSESRDSAELHSGFDTISCQIVEIITERCIEEVLDEINLK
jgi:ankyrin repeat protein